MPNINWMVIIAIIAIIGTFANTWFAHWLRERSDKRKATASPAFAQPAAITQPGITPAGNIHFVTTRGRWFIMFVQFLAGAVALMLIQATWRTQPLDLSAKVVISLSALLFICVQGLPWILQRNPANELLRRLEERTRPRGLTDSQLQHLRKCSQAISDKMPIEIDLPAHDFPATETSEVVSDQLASVLRESGFEVALKHLAKVPPAGIHLEIVFKEKLPKSPWPSNVQPFIEFLEELPSLASARSVADSAYERLTVRFAVGLDPMGRD